MSEEGSKIQVEVAVVFNDGDRSGVDSWMPAIKIGGLQFNCRMSFKTKEKAQKVAHAVAQVLAVEKVEEVYPIW